ncbi:hypothetical protein [Gorillibacterium sp. sgz5001074]|uniref:hypothetical protein n=1 Tax=Gorillibacterium sp. sgz5001074 TaxID=3446695 RepID=UPI003F67E8D2
MPEPMLRTLYKWATLRTVLPLLALTAALMIVVNTVHLPITVPRIREVSPGAELLDMHIFYTKSETYSLLDGLLPEGRRIYIGMLVGFDFIFPAVYAVTFSLIITMLYRNVISVRPLTRGLVWLPLVAGLFDWSENGSILMILLHYPDVSVAAYAAGYLTLGKWISIGLSLGVALAGIFYRPAAVRGKDHSARN